MAVHLTVFVEIPTGEPVVDWILFLSALTSYSILLVYAGFIFGEER